MAAENKVSFFLFLLLQGTKKKEKTDTLLSARGAAIENIITPFFFSASPHAPTAII